MLLYGLVSDARPGYREYLDKVAGVEYERSKEEIRKQICTTLLDVKTLT